MKPQFSYEWHFPNFTPEEVACKCGCGMMPTEKAMQLLQNLRDTVRRPLPITSGARCAAHNAKEGGAKNSYHVKGMAFDIRVNRETAMLILPTVFLNADFNGVGISLKKYWGFIHIDIRSEFEARTWTY